MLVLYCTIFFANEKKVPVFVMKVPIIVQKCVKYSLIVLKYQRTERRRSLQIKENPTQPCGLPDWPNDRIYLQSTSQGRLFKKVYWTR
jgi:hypothetical protein